MTVTVKRAGGRNRPPVAGALLPLHHRVSRLKNALRARTGSETASPPGLLRFELNGLSPPPGAAAPGGHAPQAPPLSRREWSEIVREAGAVATVWLEGANPLQSPHFEAILTACGRRDVPVVVATDGVGLEESAPVIHSLGVVGVRVRLYGTEQVHNAAVGERDAFERTARGALAIKGLSCGAPGPRLVLEIPIGPANHERLIDAVECALAMGADNVLLVHGPWRAASPAAADDVEGQGAPDAGVGGGACGVDPGVVRSQLQSVKARWRHSGVSVFPRLSESETELFYGRRPLDVGPRRCFVPWRSVTVDSRGGARFCGPEPFGSVREGPLGEIYNCASARAQRRRLRRCLAARCEFCLGRFGGGAGP